MKKLVFLSLTVGIILSCNSSTNSIGVKEPKKLIEKDKMEAILYDLALLQSTNNYNSSLLKKKNIDYNTYIYKKHNIDSLQFIENNKYYASDITSYKEMYERIIKKMEEEKKQTQATKK